MCYSDPGKAGQFKDLALTQTLSKQRSDVKYKKKKKKQCDLIYCLSEPQYLYSGELLTIINK